MDRSLEPRSRHSQFAWLRALTIAMAGLLAVPLIVNTQGLDICGCGTIPGLLPFDSTNPATHPPGTVVNGTTITLQTPPDGIFRFSSFFAQNHLNFTRNAANTPVVILVAGDATFSSTTGCCWTVTLSGEVGTLGTSTIPGVGALGGPGAYRGGDGANLTINGFSIGGVGFGPGGGPGGTPASCGGGTGLFFGASDLVPLLGGGGGGGGCSSLSPPANSTCSGGGGGGGGGALLIAANGTLTITGGYRFFADGGVGGSTVNGLCGAGGAGGAGGAIRLLANHFVGSGPAELYARGGLGGYIAQNGGTGRVRLESMDSSSQTTFTFDPPAQRIVGPTPLANPLSPTVSIISVGGNPVPVPPQGTYGSIDVVVPSAGATNVDVATSGIPGGTTVQVTAKPRLGAPPMSATIPLSTCNTAGDCQATAVFNLSAGAYVIEARATFQTE